MIEAFLTCGLICAVGQIILENTKLTPGHLNSLLTVTGSILTFFGIYEKIIEFGNRGATVPITNFGYLLFKGAYEGYLNNGFTGLITGILSLSSAGIGITIIMAFIVALIFKPKH